MNKKLLLVALPVLLAMSGCQAARGINNQPENKALVSEMSEDTLAHEEVFGDSNDIHVFAGKSNPLKATLAEPDVKLGCQIQFDDKKTDSTADDTISIRFLAALVDGNVTAVWHRGLAQPNGWEGAETSTDVWKYKFSGETNAPDLTSNVKYDALNNGGVRIAAGEEGEYENYECFVIYTLRNIPYEQFKDSYLAAYVSLGSNNSKALAVKIEKDGDYPKNSFSFDPNTTGHFIQGKINGTTQLIGATEHATGDNSASYSDLSLKSTDYFGAFYYAQGSTFQFFGYNGFVKDTANLYFEASSMGEYNKPKYDGTFSIFVSRNDFNKIYGSTTKKVSVSFATNYGTNSGQGIFIAGDDTNWKANTSYRLSNSGSDWSGTFSFTIGTSVKYIVGPWDGGDPARWESGSNHLITFETTSISCQGWQ